MTNKADAVSGGTPVGEKPHAKRGDATRAMLAVLEALITYYETVVQGTIPMTAEELKRSQKEQEMLMKQVASKQSELGDETDEGKKSTISGDLQALQNKIQINQHDQTSITRQLQALVQGSTTDIAAANKVVTAMAEFFAGLR